MSSFGPVAPHYDLLMEQVPYDMWLGYLQLLWARHDLMCDRVLDVCCGTGTMALTLAGQGYDVAGFDLSAAMIDRARAKAAEHDQEVRFEVQDAAELEMGDTYEAAYSFFDSLNYITDPARTRLAIQRVAAHLEPGGSFIFDLNTAYAFEAGMFDQHERGRRAPIRYEWVGDYDPATRLIEVNMKFWTAEGEFREVHRQRAHETEEVLAWLSDAGFTDVSIYDSYTLDKPRRRSDRVHYVAQLPPRQP
jgi:SAM-dependent methyltransferase